MLVGRVGAHEYPFGACNCVFNRNSSLGSAYSIDISMDLTPAQVSQLKAVEANCDF